MTGVQTCALPICPRRVLVRRPGETGIVQIACKVPGGLHPDHPALAVLAALLADGKTGRLYRALIDSNLALAADAAKGYFRDQTLFNLIAQLAPGSTHPQVEQALWAEVNRIRQDGVTGAEVTRAINKLLAAFAYQRLQPTLDLRYLQRSDSNADMAAMLATDLARLEIGRAHV